MNEHETQGWFFMYEGYIWVGLILGVLLILLAL